MNDDAPERIKQLAQKVLRLKEAGRAGEADAAENRLDHLIDKYDLDLNELRAEDEPREDHVWTYKTKWDKKILHQTIASIVGKERAIYRIKKGNSNRYRQAFCVACTDAEAVDISERYEYYKDLWREEMRGFMSAFIQKHELVPPGPGTKEMSDEELYELLNRIGALSGESYPEDEDDPDLLLYS